MSRLPCFLAIALATLAAAPAAAPAARAPATAGVTECQPGGAGTTRVAAFQGRMRSLPGTRRMQMRFTLLERLGDGSFRKVEARGLDVWRTSRLDARRFVYTQRVDGLKADAAYRVAVDYRWLEAGRRSQRFARRRSAVCEVEGALPNLRPIRISVWPGEVPGTARYSVVLRNSGAVDAANVAVGLLVDGVGVASTTLSSLAALETRTLRFDGPACATSVSAVVDPEGALRETTEDDNVLSMPCPPA